jgi:hypothetical protein
MNTAWAETMESDTADGGTDLFSQPLPPPTPAADKTFDTKSFLIPPKAKDDHDKRLSLLESKVRAMEWRMKETRDLLERFEMIFTHDLESIRTSVEQLRSGSQLPRALVGSPQQQGNGRGRGNGHWRHNNHNNNAMNSQQPSTRPPRQFGSRRDPIIVDNQGV